MPTESVTLAVPDSLARELDSVGEGFLIDLLERGLREFKIEQALDRYARGGISFGGAARQEVVTQGLVRGAADALTVRIYFPLIKRSC